jgi:hypothetical protein
VKKDAIRYMPNAIAAATDSFGRSSASTSAWMASTVCARARTVTS